LVPEYNGNMQHQQPIKRALSCTKRRTYFRATQMARKKVLPRLWF